MSISISKSDLSKIKLPERFLDLLAGAFLAIIFMIGISFQFSYSRHVSNGQSLARPRAAPPNSEADTEALPEISEVTARVSR